MNRQYEANDTLSAVWGSHQIKFGADVIFARNGGNSKEFGGPIYDGQFAYKTCTQALAVCESSAYLDNINNVQSYTQSYGNANYTVNDTLWALFVQDNYHARRDLTINLGLRYEQQTFTDSRHDFAPRVGFAYNWRGEAKTVIRGGFGIYYSQVVDNSEANYALTGPTGVFNYIAGPGQIGFPASVSAAPLPAFPAGAVAPLRSLYVRPGETAYLNQFFPVSTLIGYPNQLLNPVFRTMDLRGRAAACSRVDSERGLRRLAHLENQSSTGRRPAISFHPYRTRSEPLGSSGKLHASLLDFLVRAKQFDLQPRSGDQSSAAVCRDSNGRQ